VKRLNEWIVSVVLGILLAAVVLLASRTANMWLLTATESFDWESARFAAVAWILLGGALAAFVAWKKAHPMALAIPAFALIVVNSHLFLGPLDFPDWMAEISNPVAGGSSLALAGVLLCASGAAFLRRRMPRKRPNESNHPQMAKGGARRRTALQDAPRIGENWGAHALPQWGTHDLRSAGR
jgi:hypothetical protein